MPHNSAQVRPATHVDVQAIQKLLNHYASMGDLLPRTRDDILKNLEHFRVIEQQGDIIACGSLENFTDELAEIRSLMVRTDIKGSGLGREIVQHLIEMAQARQVKRLMALTYVPIFFHKLGFKTVNKEIFPEKIWGICVNCYKFKNCDEIAVLMEL
ncbi:N-acetyltransferase [Arenicella xantha]|uniref:Amino-acid acetyltransferase n=1 Tax=Arenicella xantha TaxID=644221 RepID=A0A395JJC1_9GAMM|nr:N-acetyltransferase [Arenicella xantha]RBP50822.1 amino-acid N-acetyltransferase [Arenicella xantha]